MDSDAVQTAQMDPSDPYQADCGGWQQAVLAAGILHPFSTPGCWKRRPGPPAGTSCPHQRWTADMMCRFSDDPLTFRGLDQSKRLKAKTLQERQSTYGQAISYPECGPVCGGFLVPPQLCAGNSRPSEEIALTVDVLSPLSTCGGEEMFSDDQTKSHKNIPLAIVPSHGLERSLTTSPQSLLAPFRGYSCNESGLAPSLCDQRSVAPSQNFLSPDVCYEDTPRPHTCPVYLGRELSVGLLSSEVRPIGFSSATPISSSTGLVGGPTERWPSHAYSPRAGTGYVPLRYNEGSMTDAVPASARPRIVSPSSKVQILPAAQNSRSYNSFNDTWDSVFPGRTSPNSPPSSGSIRSRRCASTPTLAVDSLHGVYDSRMNLVEPRKRRQFSASEREETRRVRVKGACDLCKRKKRRVNILLFVGRLPSSTRL